MEANAGTSFWKDKDRRNAVLHLVQFPLPLYAGYLITEMQKHGRITAAETFPLIAMTILYAWSLLYRFIAVDLLEIAIRKAGTVQPTDLSYWPGAKTDNDENAPHRIN